MRMQRDAATADRLELPGAEGYPNCDEMAHVGYYMGGSCQCLIDGASPGFGRSCDPSIPPLIVFLQCMATDGAGHESEHWVVKQSYIKLADDPINIEENPMVVCPEERVGEALPAKLNERNSGSVLAHQTWKLQACGRLCQHRC